MRVQNISNGPEVAQKIENGPVKRGKLSKSHQDFWTSKLQKRSYASNGKTVEIPDWQVRIAHLGRREWFNLASPNQAKAAVTARDIYASLIAHGWEKTLARFKPEMIVASKGATIGEFLAEVQAVSQLNPVTFAIYARKFRTLVAGVFGLRGGREKFNYATGGHQLWLDRVNRVRLDKLTPQRIQKWSVGYLKAANGNPLKHKRASTTLNSVLRGSKALFSAKIRRFLTIRLPDPLPFDGIETPKLGKSRYKSEINPGLLLQRAKRDAETVDPETGEPLLSADAFKIILLALGAGLRRDEIDTLTWKQMEWQRSVIRVETNEHTHAKSDDSEAEVDVDPALMKMFQAQMRASHSPFVIDSPVNPRPSAYTYSHYRSERHFNRVIAWLREQGITALNPLHSLRKEFGSQVCAQGGVFAASLALRHSNISLTREHYLDKKKVTVFQIAELLSPKSDEPKTVKR